MNKPHTDDIFDRLMGLPGLRVFRPFYTRHREGLLYLFFGGITFFLSLFLFFLFYGIIGWNELLANVVGWVICVLFQFFTNRTWVFDGHVEGVSAFFRQMAGFFGGRLFTLAVEEVILAVFITWLHWNSMGVKLVAQIIVILLNYVISKLWVFKS